MRARDLLTVPYRVVRVPVSIAEFKIGQRLPDRSLTRELIALSVRTADHLAGWVLRDESLARISSED